MKKVLMFIILIVMLLIISLPVFATTGHQQWNGVYPESPVVSTDNSNMYQIIYGTTTKYLLITSGTGHQGAYFYMHTASQIFGGLGSFYRYTLSGGQWTNQEGVSGAQTIGSVSDIVMANSNVYTSSERTTIAFAKNTLTPTISNISIEDGHWYDNFLGLSFDYSGFLGHANISLGKKDTEGSYQVIQDLTPSGQTEGSGSISISDTDISYANNGDYRVTITDSGNSSTVYNYYYTVSIPDSNINEIIAPSDNASIDYFPNIQLSLQNKSPVNIKINGQTVKRIASTAGKLITDIIAYESGGSLLQLGLNLIEIVDDDGNILDSNEFTVLRENIIDTGGDDLPSKLDWSPVGQTIQEYKETYSEFINTVATVFSFLPSPWITLGTFGIGISLILWFVRLR